MARIGRPPAMSVEARKEAIYSTAEALFGERGYEKVTMSEVAAAARMSKKTLYQHFPDKEALLRGLVESSYIWSENAFEAPTGDPVDGLRHRLRVVARHVLSERHVKLCRLAIGESVGMEGLADAFLKKSIGESRHKLIESVRRIDRQCYRVDLPPETLADMLYGACCGLALMRALLTHHLPPLEDVYRSIDSAVSKMFDATA